MNTTENKQDQGIIRNNSELDSTLLIIGGWFIAVLVVVGIFTIHIMNPEGSLLSPEILMALIMLPGTLISFAMGKKSGRAEAIATNGTSTPHQTKGE